MYSTVNAIGLLSQSFSSSFFLSFLAMPLNAMLVGVITTWDRPSMFMSEEFVESRT
jgi:hypothetical protein